MPDLSDEWRELYEARVEHLEGRLEHLEDAKVATHSNLINYAMLGLFLVEVIEGLLIYMHG